MYGGLKFYSTESDPLWAKVLQNPLVVSGGNENPLGSAYFAI